MEDKLAQELEAWGKEKVAYTFPRWEQIPDIELYMDQVIALLEKHFHKFPGDSAGKLISPSMINNYVKQGIIPPTIKKRYSRTHIAYLMMLCTLKPVLPLAVVQGIIEFQLQTKTFAEVYDHFAIEQEQASVYTMAQAKAESELLGQTAATEQEMLSNLSLKMAVLANSSKILAEKIIEMERAEGKLSTLDDKGKKVKRSKCKTIRHIDN
ncbi:DUF1836 domain-containing protein [Paenibacillus nuruki]|uniref:DUF1836 domain-containing protein n=1 Tax=Paenibacillus nuruki TaxID=1886670 RepID=UPI00280461B0|nr:DUF1836 domain-containing protein [Paenibacillus nuruki]CAJ1314681.1 DUF1836 domain-containing protein [Paenibacillus nuruki]